MSLPELTDAELAESRKLLLRFARIQLPDRPDLAEDLVQETMLSAYRAAEGFKGDAQVGSWLFAILKNKITDCLRQIGRQREIFTTPVEEMLDEAFEERFASDGHWTADGHPQTWSSPEKTLDNKEFREILQTCLYQMPENTARVFTMKKSSASRPTKSASNAVSACPTTTPSSIAPAKPCANACKSNGSAMQDMPDKTVRKPR